MSTLLGCPSSEVNEFDGAYLLCQRFQIIPLCYKISCMARFCLRCHVRLSVLSSVVMYLPVKSFILMMISSMVLILPAYVNQPKTSKSITLCEYYCIIHLCHHSNFSATLLKPNPIHYFWRGPNITEIYGQMGVQIFQEGSNCISF